MRRSVAVRNSPGKKPYEKVVAGMQEHTDELLRSHYLMYKIRSKESVPLIQRPATAEGGLSLGLANIEGLARPLSMLNFNENLKQQLPASDFK